MFQWRIINLLLCIFLVVGESTTTSTSHSPLDGIPVTIDRIDGDVLCGHVKSNQLTRLFFIQQEKETFPMEQARNQSNYLFSLVPNGKFRVFIDLLQIPQKPFVTILVETVDSKQYGYLNYRYPLSQLSCNSQELTIQSVEDLKDSCVRINIYFEGTGDLYLLGRLSGYDDPDTANIIQEGLYLGRSIL